MLRERAMLYSRITVEQVTTGLFTCDIDTGYNVRTFRGFLSDGAARSFARSVSQNVFGRVALFQN
jgi:hypothetical protein